MKKLDKEAYTKYMKVVKGTIKETEDRMKRLPTHKQVLGLSYEDWVKWQRGELKLNER